ncbi:LuxR C-terminal-related transcriptional regulator [Paenibacillus pasadenensis]|uniref:LuxR C-terminal-related transcriptional regulator n=1 Tax=Paenibacillus pasadenensis TaxID=217090 RepID=UPI00041B4F08|nr:LuxR C-terminal-related transcriptional regulator [Paenibacillus pasadenensis]
MDDRTGWRPPLAKITLPAGGLGGLTARPRLVRMLEEGSSCRLMTVAAPAGYGKTTLLRQWAEQAGRPVAWLSLDEADDDVPRFWRLVACALEQALPPDSLRRSLPLSSALSSLSAAAFLDALTGELAEAGGRLALVLDDFHHIREPGIQEQLAYWLRYLPPGVGVVTAGRSALRVGGSRWAAEGKRLDLTAAELAFTEEEAGLYLDAAFPGSFTPAQQLRLHQATEGWAAGLQLSGLSGAASLGREAGGEELAEFLMEEAYGRLPGELKRFLLLSALPERIDAELAGAAAGCGREEAEALLGRVRRDSLFLLPAGADGWHRYHALFRSFLLRRPELAEPSRRDALHRCALELDRRGLAAEAIGCALSAGDGEWSSDKLDAFAAQALEKGDARSLLGLLERLSGLRELTAEQQLMRAFLLAVGGRFEAAGAAMDGARRIAESLEPGEERSRLNSGLLFVESNRIFFGGRFELWQQLADRAGRELLPAEGMYFNVDFNRSEPQVRRADIGMKGVLSSDTEAIGRQFAGMLEEGGWGGSQVSLYVRLALAEGYFEWNRLEECRSMLAGVLLDRSAHRTAGLAVPAAILQAQLHAAEGKLDSALEELLAAERLETALEPQWQAGLIAARARLLLQAGQAAPAQRALASLGLPGKEPAAYHREYELMTLVRLLLSQRKLEQALLLLDSLERLQRREGLVSGLAETAALRALAEQGRGRREEALRALGQALEIGEANGYVRLFVAEGAPMRKLLAAFRAGTRGTAGGDAPGSGYVERLLGAFDYAPPRVLEAAAPLAERLTEQELILLRHLAEGAANREIADSLGLTPGTVRVYLSRLYGKLGVASRLQAVHAAQELRLLHGRHG